MNTQNFRIGIWIVIIMVIIVAISPITYKNWLKRNDELVQVRSSSLFLAIENYLIDNNGEYPKSREDLVGFTWIGVKTPYCNDRWDGYVYECLFSQGTFGMRAYPIKMNVTGHFEVTKSKSMAYIKKYFTKDKRYPI